MASEKGAKPAEAPAAAAAAEAPKKNSMVKMGMVAAIVLVLECATVGVTMMLSGGPKKVVAEVPTSAPAEAVEHDAEVSVLSEMMPNKLAHLCVYDLQVVANVDEKNKAKATGLIEEHKNRICDRVRTIIASSDSKSLEEPGLETLRRQISYQIQEELGKGLIKEVLIPRCTPHPTPW